MLEAIGILFSAALGFAVGAFLLLLFLKHLDEYEPGHSIHKKKKVARAPKDVPTEGCLRHKLPDKEVSATDFNCAADGLEASIYIAGHQQNKDDAYNTLKYRKQ